MCEERHEKPPDNMHVFIFYNENSKLCLGAQNVIYLFGVSKKTEVQFSDISSRFIIT